MSLIGGFRGFHQKILYIKIFHKKRLFWVLIIYVCLKIKLAQSLIIILKIFNFQSFFHLLTISRPVISGES